MSANYGVFSHSKGPSDTQDTQVTKFNKRKLLKVNLRLSPRIPVFVSRVKPKVNIVTVVYSCESNMLACCSVVY